MHVGHTPRDVTTGQGGGLVVVVIVGEGVVFATAWLRSVALSRRVVCQRWVELFRLSGLIETYPITPYVARLAFMLI